MFLPDPGESHNFEPAPEGSHPATCIKFVDKGTQHSEYQGKIIVARRVMLVFELCDELMTDGKPFLISKNYTWSMHEKSNFRRDLESWRGKKFERSEIKQFNTQNLLGKNCLLMISHVTKKDGTIFAGIEKVGALPKQMKSKTAVNPIVYFALTLEGWDSEIFSKLGQKTRDTIMASPEYHALQKKLSNDADYDNDDGMPAQIGSDTHEEEIPF
jgi:hypothetical protein